MLEITTPPHPVLFLVNLLGYRGPTIVKPVPCLEPSPLAWTPGGSGQGLYGPCPPEGQTLIALLEL